MCFFSLHKKSSYFYPESQSIHIQNPSFSDVFLDLVMKDRAKQKRSFIIKVWGIV